MRFDKIWCRSDTESFSSLSWNKKKFYFCFTVFLFCFVLNLFLINFLFIFDMLLWISEEVADISHSSPIDIRKLQLGISKAQKYDDSEEFSAQPPRSPGVTRAFPIEARPPTPPNARHMVRGNSVLPKTPPSTPAT